MFSRDAPVMLYELIVHHRLLCITTVVLSLLVSLWALYLDPVVNVDGIIYIKAAEHFTEGHWDTALSIYKWPFYSFIISMVAQAAGMTEGHAAYLVNGSLYVLMLLGFVALVKSLGGKIGRAHV